MSRLWFRAKRYGWGWSPASIEGWLVLAVFFAAVAADIVVFSAHMRGGDHGTALVVFLVWLGVLSAALIAVCWLTGERPRWRWGGQ
jgi:hypothetical protein